MTTPKEMPEPGSAAPGGSAAEEQPFNPPGMDAYIQRGAAINARLLRKATCQQIAEIPPGLEWCKDRALQLISRSGPEDFDDYVTWAKWCRNVAGAGLMQDPARLEMFEKQGGVTLPPNDQAHPQPGAASVGGTETL